MSLSVTPHITTKFGGALILDQHGCVSHCFHLSSSSSAYISLTTELNLSLKILYQIPKVCKLLVSLKVDQPRSLASSTSTISTSRCLGERLMTLWTVRSRVLHASLWNTMTMLVLGRSSGYTLFLHLMERQYKDEISKVELNKGKLQTDRFCHLNSL